MDLRSAVLPLWRFRLVSFGLCSFEGTRRRKENVGRDRYPKRLKFRKQTRKKTREQKQRLQKEQKQGTGDTCARHTRTCSIQRCRGSLLVGQRLPPQGQTREVRQKLNHNTPGVTPTDASTGGSQETFPHNQHKAVKPVSRVLDKANICRLMAAGAAAARLGGRGTSFSLAGAGRGTLEPGRACSSC